MKAQITLTHMIIGGIIGVLILIVIISGIADPYVNRILNIIPDYNTAKPPAEFPQILRYSIPNDTVEYHDGLSWIPFPKEKPEDWNQAIKLSDKNISHREARFYFANWYYGSQRPKPTSERLVHLEASSEFQSEIKKWYEKASTWQLISSAAPFNIIIRRLNDRKDINGAFGTTEIDLVSKNYFIDEDSETSLSIGTSISVSGIFGVKNILYVYDGEIPSGIFVTELSGVIETGEYQGKIFAHLAEKDKTRYVPDETIQEIGYLQKDASGKYLLIVNKDSLVSTEQELSIGQRLRGIKQIEPRDYSLATKLSLNKYYLEDLKSNFGNNIIVDTKSYGRFYLSSLDELAFDKVSDDIRLLENSPFGPISKQTPLYISVVPSAILWRDSIFAIPMCICYNSDKDCTLHAVEKRTANNNVYLVSDLSKSLGDCE